MTIDPRLEEQLRQGFKYFNHFMLLMWRLRLAFLLGKDGVVCEP